MNKVIASIITVGSILPMMWYTVTPNGVEICSSSTEFNTITPTETNRAAAKYAKVKFCHVVSSFPR